MADIFHEVDEEVRRERLTRLWQRYGNLLIAACVLVVAGIGAWRGYDYWRGQKAAQAGIAFEQAASLAEAGNHKGAAAAFARIATDGTTGYRELARLRAAAAMAQTDRKAAIAAYDAIAADRNAGPVIGDLAALRAGVLRVDTDTYADMRKRLEPLTGADRTFRFTARELLAMSAWKSGDMSATQKWADMLTSDPSTPSGTRNRAQILSELIAANGKG